MTEPSQDPGQDNGAAGNSSGLQAKNITGSSMPASAAALLAAGLAVTEMPRGDMGGMSAGGAPGAMSSGSTAGLAVTEMPRGDMAAMGAIGSGAGTAGSNLQLGGEWHLILTVKTVSSA